MIKLISTLIEQGVTPVFDSRLKANRVEYLLARHQGVHVARDGRVPSAVATKLGEALAGVAADRTLLSERQALLLWEDTIARSRLTAALLDARSVARWAREAAALASDYGIPIQRLGNEPAAETQAVAGWWRTVSKLQAANGWLDPRGLLVQAEEAVRKGQLRVKQYAWLDRDISHPIATKLARQMYLTEPAPVDLALETPTVAVYPEPMEELRAAAAWAYATVAEGNVAGQVAIVVPSLADRLQDVEQCFADLAPAGASAPFIAAGSALLAQPSVRTALALIELVLGNRSFAVASAVLRSPQLFKGQELTGRAALDRLLREQPDGQVWLASADGVGRLDHQHKANARRFVKALDKLSAARPRPGHSASPMQWADDIRHWLRLAGWYSGAPTLDQAWNDVLLRLASLGFNDTRFTANSVLAALRREVADARVAKEMGPIEVLGRIDDVGIGCDHVWITGLAETQYPHLPKPNPMLPLALQRQWGVPGASAADRARHAVAALARVRGLAKEVKLSYPRSQGDAPNSVHPAVAAWPQRDIAAPTVGRTLALLGALDKAEYCPDPIPPMTTPLKKGASQALKRQAVCPASAFFEFRLGAQPLEQPRAGVRAQDRGIWAHNVCEHLFERLHNSDLLRAATLPARTELIVELVDKELRGTLGRAHGAYRAAVQVEQRLLQRRLLTLLEAESRRADFEVIEREVVLRQDIGPLSVRVRLDRVDRLTSGDRVVVDYKTGQQLPGPNKWTESPLRDTQLPLYVMMAGSNVRAALFVQLQPEKTRYRGVWPRGAFPSKPAQTPAWRELTSLWQLELARLAADFVAGRGWFGSDQKPLEGNWAPLSRIYASSHNRVEADDG